MKIGRVPGLIATAMLLAVTSPSSIAASFQRWDRTTKVDQMDGSRTHFIHTESQQTLTGWQGGGHARVGIKCNDRRVYLRVDGLGFETDELEESRRSQIVRTKVDDSEPYRMEFDIWPQNKDGMTYSRSWGASSYGQDDLISDMKEGKELLVEVKLYKTKGREQIARFSLAGFTAAISWCEQRVAADEVGHGDGEQKGDMRSEQLEAMRKARDLSTDAEKVREEPIGDLLHQYKQAILRRVQSEWRQPESFSKSDRAEVQVTQLPSGDVTDVEVLACTGDTAFCDSVVSALRRASPLPAAPEPDVFERVLRFTFRPGLGR